MRFYLFFLIDGRNKLCVCQPTRSGAGTAPSINCTTLDHDTDYYSAQTLLTRRLQIRL